MSDALPGTAARRRVYLMRHGEVAYFDANGDVVHPKYVELTETGQGQARGDLPGEGERARSDVRSDDTCDALHERASVGSENGLGS